MVKRVIKKGYKFVGPRWDVYEIKKKEDENNFLCEVIKVDEHYNHFGMQRSFTRKQILEFEKWRK